MFIESNFPEDSSNEREENKGIRYIKERIDKLKLNLPDSDKLDNITIYFKPYPVIEINKDWDNNSIISFEGEYIYYRDVEGPQLLKTNSVYTDQIRWARDMSISDTHKWDIQHIYISTEDKNSLNITLPEIYGIVSVNIIYCIMTE